MAMSFSTNFNVKGTIPNFTRDMFVDKATMVSFSENYLPDIFIATCVEDGKIYLFNKSNEIDPELGKWRLVDGDGAKLKKELVSSVDVGMIEDGTTYDSNEPLENVIREMLTGKVYEEDTVYYGAIDSPLLSSLDDLTMTCNPVVSVDADNQYIVFATELSLGDLVIKDAFGDLTSDYNHTIMPVGGETFNVYVCKFRITCLGCEYKLTFK